MNNSSISDYLETKVCRYGVFSYFKNDTVIGASLRQYGEWAQNEIDFLLNLIQPGDIVFDVGAFIGTHTLAFAKKVSEEGRVYSYEPNPFSFQVLKLNVTQNKLSNVVCEQIALSDKLATLHFDHSNWDEGNPGATSLLGAKDVKGRDVSDFEIINVKCLDQINIPSCQLIKIDTEGMESNVLAGGINFIKKHRPYIYAECLSVENGSKFIPFLDKAGYEAYIHSVLAYSLQNVYGGSDHVIRSAREVNILLVPEENATVFQGMDISKEVIPFSNLDELVLAMVTKPQYKVEVLENTNAAKVLGVDYFLQGDTMSIDSTIVERIDELQLGSDPNNKQIQDLTHRIERIEREHLAKIESLTHKHQEELHWRKQTVQNLLTRVYGLREDLENKDRSIEKLNSQIAAVTQELENTSRQLSEITHSRAWKAILAYRNIRIKLFPPGSFRLRFIKAIINGIKLLFTAGPVAFTRRFREKISNRMPEESTRANQLPIETTVTPGTKLIEHPNPVYIPDEIGVPPSADLRGATSGTVDEDALTELWAVVQKSIKNRNFVISISHDDYLTIMGGSQMFIADEQNILGQKSISHIHLYPIRQDDFINNEPSIEVGLNIDSTHIGQYPLSMIVNLESLLVEHSYTCLSLNLHHFMGWSMSGLKAILANARAKQLIFYVHDYFSVCPQFILLRNNVEFCNAPDIDSHACTICVFSEKRKIHLPLAKDLISSFPFLVIAPSRSAKSLWQKAFPDFSGEVRIEPHLIVKESTELIPVRSEKPIRIAFAGSPHKTKGWEIWRELVGKFLTDEHYKFFHLGTRYSTHDEEFVSVRVSPNDRSAMADALRDHQIDVLFHFTLNPETFSFVLYEAIAAGCFVLTYRQSGNVADYVRDNHNGIVFGSKDDLIEYLSDPDTLRKDLVNFRELHSRIKIIEKNETIPCLIASPSMEN